MGAMHIHTDADHQPVVSSTPFPSPFCELSTDCKFTVVGTIHRLINDPLNAARFCVRWPKSNFTIEAWWKVGDTRPRGKFKIFLLGESSRATNSRVIIPFMISFFVKPRKSFAIDDVAYVKDQIRWFKWRENYYFPSRCIEEIGGSFRIFRVDRNGAV